MFKLQESEIKKYWNKRAAAQGMTTVGNMGTTEEQQEIAFQKVKDKISRAIYSDLFTIDYGCGVGRFAEIFNPHNYP